MFMTKIYTAISFGILYYVYHYFLGVETRNKLIVILIDGLRSDFMDNRNPDDFRGFQRFLENGSRAEYMDPVYPSVAYPEWTSLVTGLWPESHGIVGNYLYDSVSKDEFDWSSYVSVKKGKWWTAEPLWITATKNQLKTGVLHWGECDVEFEGLTPEFCLPITDRRRIKDSFGSNVQFALSMLDLDYDFLQIYEGGLFEKETIYGPESTAADDKLREIDRDIEFLLDKIEARAMGDKVNIIIVGGRGVVSVDQSTVRRVNLDEFLDNEKVENVAGLGAFANIKVKEGHVEEVFERLSEMPGVSVYKHDDIPDHLHVKDSKFTHDIWIEADSDTYIVPSGNGDKMSSQRDYFGVPMGANGYDSDKAPGMRAAFMAYGPDFRSGFSFPAINTVDVYPLLTYLLQLESLPNNGSFETIGMSLIDLDQGHDSQNETQDGLYGIDIYSYDVTFVDSETIYGDWPSNSTTLPNNFTDQESGTDMKTTTTAEELPETGGENEPTTTVGSSETSVEEVTTETPAVVVETSTTNLGAKVSTEKPQSENNETSVTDPNSNTTTEKPSKETNDTSVPDLDSNLPGNTNKDDTSKEDNPLTINEYPEDSGTTLSPDHLTTDRNDSSMGESSGLTDEQDGPSAHGSRILMEPFLLFQMVLFLILAYI